MSGYDVIKLSHSIHLPLFFANYLCGNNLKKCRTSRFMNFSLNFHEIFVKKHLSRSFTCWNGMSLRGGPKADEAIEFSILAKVDCFALLAMTKLPWLPRNDTL